jgi:hypothetical protein
VVRNTPIDRTPKREMGLNTLVNAQGFNAVLPHPGQKITPAQRAAIIQNAVRFHRHTGHGPGRHPAPQPVPKPGFFTEIGNFVSNL